MDRIDEFRKIVKIYEQNYHNSKTLDSKDKGFDKSNEYQSKGIILSQFLQIVCRVSVAVKSNELILNKMNKLCSRKEFSNDPSQEMAELSDSFHSKTLLIKQDLQILKQQSDNTELKSQHMQHYSMMTQTLTKMLTSQVQSFKSYANTHAQNLKQRQQRVAKYGQGIESTGLQGLEQQQHQYAMFAASTSLKTNPTLTNGHIHSQSHNGNNNNNSNNSNSNSSNSESQNQGLLRRRTTMISTVHKSPYISSAVGMEEERNHHLYQQQQQQQQLRLEPPENRRIKENRLSNTQRIEATIAQMGDLFTQLSTLILQQSETITRIEDDIEIGLEETKKGHSHMERFYEISKGNRSMIFKIFGLLIFFIFLFLYFT